MMEPEVDPVVDPHPDPLAEPFPMAHRLSHRALHLAVDPSLINDDSRMGSDDDGLAQGRGQSDGRKQKDEDRNGAGTHRMPGLEELVSTT